MPELSAATPLSNGHWRDIDGLRGIVVALVVAYQANPSIASGGYVGVDVARDHDDTKE